MLPGTLRYMHGGCRGSQASIHADILVVPRLGLLPGTLAATGLLNARWRHRCLYRVRVDAGRLIVPAGCHDIALLLGAIARGWTGHARCQGLCCPVNEIITVIFALLLVIATPDATLAAVGGAIAAAAVMTVGV